MIRKIERDEIAAELAGIESLLAHTPATDPVARISFESRRGELQAQLQVIADVPANEAAIALYFGGKPVIGSRAINADFATSVLATFQDIVSKLWFSQSHAEVGARGPMRFDAGSQLHITNVVHGSFGFILEEVDSVGRLFPSPLKDAVDSATELVCAFAGEDETGFQQLIDEINPRVFSSMRDFFRQIQKDEAVFRIVEGDAEYQFDRSAVERAYERAEEAAVDEEEILLEGELLGVIPIAGRFEFRSDRGDIISGKVASNLSESYLERVEREQLVGRMWIAKLRRREVKRFGRKSESFLLLDLTERRETPNPPALGTH